MAVRLNHTIVSCRDQKRSADFFCEIFGRPAATRWGPFLDVVVENGVTFAFLEQGEGSIVSQHYAFLVDEDDFDEIFGRVVARGLDYWADPMKSLRSEINDHDGGRGVYFDDPDGHFLEIITRPYGSGGWTGYGAD